MKRKLERRCAWCGRTDVEVTDDHIFPRSIGGTKELAVPACPQCQTSFSKAEKEFARSSPYAIFTAEAGPRGRHKRKRKSGLIRAKYILVRHPLGGWGETGLRAGGGIGEALPYIEIDVKGHAGARVRGKQRSDVDRLIEAVSAIVFHPLDTSGFVGEISIRTDHLGEIANDEDFWPRVVLDLGGDLFIRARDLAEAQRFFSILVPALKRGSFNDKGTWTASEITAGTVHTVGMEYDAQSIQRVIAKIAWGLVHVRLRQGAICKNTFSDVRAAVLAERPTGITQVSVPGTMNVWPKRHVALVGPSNGLLRGIVSLYGDCHTIGLGLFPNPDQFKLIVAFCEIDGSRAFLVEGEEAVGVERILEQHIADQKLNAS